MKINIVVRSWFTLFSLVALTVSINTMAAPPSKYDGIRDPFQRPDRKPNVGESKTPPHSSSGGRWEDGGPPPKKEPVAKPPVAPPDPLAQEFQRWISVYNFVNAAWRPTLVYVAGEVKSVAIENATIALNDIARAYFVGAGWAKSNVKWLAPKVISRLFTLYSILEPSDLDPSSELDINSNIGPDSEKLRDYLKRLNEKTKKESVEIKVMWSELPNDFRVPASAEPPIDVSTEEQRRKAIFSDQNLTKDQARTALAKAAGQIYGDAARRFTEDWLWLYDEDRLRRDGLSQAAIDLFYEGEKLIGNFKPPAGKRKIANACLIQPPNWSGTPAVWACTLPYTNNPTKDCYCPTPPEIGLIIAGTPKRFARGMACVVPEAGACPMLHSEPLGTLCGCSGYPGLLGQIH